MRMKSFLLMCSSAVLAFNLQAQGVKASADSQVAEIVGKVDVANYKECFVKIPVNASDKRGYGSDKQPQEGLVKARTAIKESLVNSLGEANVTTQEFEARGYKGLNIIGKLPGSKHPDKQYLISAHYDSEQNPGADDDATGVAGVLEAARVLSKYEFEATIIFAAFDYEEGRKDEYAQGSLAYAKKAQEAGDKILGMISMDMIAYHAADVTQMTLSRCDSKKGSRSAKLVDALKNSYSLYTSLGVQVVDKEDSSDPVRFYDAGYPAVLVSEKYDANGIPVNPYYHESKDYYLDDSGNPQQYDGRDYLDFDYAVGIVKGVVGWAATDAKLIKTRGVSR